MFVPTHTINGTQVQKVTSEKGWPRYFKEDGTQVHVGKGRKSIPLPPVEEPYVGRVPPPPPPDAVAVIEKEDTTLDDPRYQSPVIGRKVTFHIDLAMAVLRAAAWPAYGSAIGYAETLKADSVSLTGDGTTARVCLMTPKGGRFFNIRIPESVEFELTEEDE